MSKAKSESASAIRSDQPQDLATSPYAVLQRLGKCVKEETGFPVKSMSVMLYVSPEVFDPIAEANPELVQHRTRTAPTLHVAMGDLDMDLTRDTMWEGDLADPIDDDEDDDKATE